MLKEDVQMAIDERTQAEQQHALILKGRGMETSLGLLLVRGSGLHIERLSLEGGELELEGEIDSMEYEESGQHRGGLFTRIFG